MYQIDELYNNALRALESLLPGELTQWDRTVTNPPVDFELADTISMVKLVMCGLGPKPPSRPSRAVKSWARPSRYAGQERAFVGPRLGFALKPPGLGRQAATWSLVPTVGFRSTVKSIVINLAEKEKLPHIGISRGK